MCYILSSISSPAHHKMQSDLTIDNNIAKVKNVLIEEQIVDISMYSKKTQIRMTIMHLQLL